jgi:hypothetical protein
MCGEKEIRMSSPPLNDATALPDGSLLGYDTRQLVVDIRVGSLLLHEARRVVVTRMFGVPVEKQTFLVTMALLGGATTVLLSLVPRVALPSSTEVEMGGAVINTALLGLAGPPAAAIPLAGGLIGFAVLAHSLRPAVAASVHAVRGVAHAVDEVLGLRFSRG